MPADLADTCPWCRNDIRPHAVVTNRHVTTASYRCPGCRKTWTCQTEPVERAES